MTQERVIKSSVVLLLFLACLLLVRYATGNAAGGTALWTTWDAVGPAIGAGQNERPAAVKLSDYNREDDFPSIAVGKNGEVWLVWSSYSALKDEIRLRRYAEGRWYTFTRVPGVSGDVWLPQVAVDQQNRVWVVWSQQVENNFDLYAAYLAGNAWSKVERLTTDPQPDNFHRLIADGQGRLWLVWQGGRNGQFDIFLKRFDGTAWSKEMRVTDHPANDWEPAVAVDSRGRAHVVWDSYRNGNYDVLLRSMNAEGSGELVNEIAVAATPMREGHASIACDKQDRVWVAWDAGGVNWGKDQGYTLRPNPPGVVLYDSRQIGVKVFTGSAAKEPVGEVKDALPQGERQYLQAPLLTVDVQGRVWLAFHHRRAVEAPGPNQPQRVRNYWEAYVTHYEGNAWSPPVALPDSWTRISAVQSIAPATDGQMWLAWNTDGRTPPDTHVPVKNDVYVTALAAPAGAAIEAVLQEPRAVAVQPRAGHKDEPGDVRAIRDYRATVSGKQMRIVRGDFHRHTELSWDGGGFRDSSLLDFYRYMIDAAAMDFGASTDHNAGGDYEYWWWLTQKLTDLHHLPLSYVALFGYERSAIYPNGHRNIIHATRNVPVVSFFTRSDLQGARPGVGTGALLDNDTKLLYEEIRKSGGIAISHTSATRMGTDWRDNDPTLEPVVEIFQGARTSYEYAGAPKSADPDKDSQHIQQAGYQPAGFVWNAWAKGYRLGVITSSDHGSTHISYALVYTDDYSRQGIVEAIRRRRTYGATDNIILEYRADDHFMGEEFTTVKAPKLSVKVIGTDEVTQIDIIKNNTFAYTAKPNQRSAQFTWLDNKLDAGVSYYYVRVMQRDGQIAWSSPIWVNYKPQ